MEFQTLRQVEKALEDKHFKVLVDLGIGFGEVAPVLKKHCDYLIGVDITLERVRLSGYDVLYNQLIEEDARTYTIPVEADGVSLFDLVEHFKFNEGLDLLRKIGSRFCILTTPSKFFQGALNGHASLWSVEDLNNLGFKTVLFKTGFFRDILYGQKILGVREEGRL